MAQTQTIGKTATSVRRDPDGTLRVRYHATEVVRVDPDGTIHLDTGGWKTVTTKARMNQTANQFGLGFQVRQSNYEWFVQIPDAEGNWYSADARTIPFDRNYLVFNLKHGEALAL